jgi:two-component system KDP operon response regulator KdpE
MSTGQHAILIVDDNLRIRSYLKMLLSASSYHVLEATDGAAAVAMLRAHHVDLVLLDMEMPVLPGLEALKQMRGFWQGPVIMVSAIEAVSSKVDALDKGASDYIEKPFNETELLARIRANLRRSPDQKRVIWGGGIELDLSTGMVARDGKPIRLSRMEAILMMALVRQSGAIVPSAELVNELWGRDDEHSRHTLRVFIRKLRLKVEPDPESPQIIMTEKQGYRIIMTENLQNGA